MEIHNNKLEVENRIKQFKTKMNESQNENGGQYISAKIEVIQSSTGQDYLALTVDNNDIIPYINFLDKQIDNEFIQNQQNRDKQQYHLTLINAMQFGKLQKHNPEELDKILKEYLSQIFEVSTEGIGSAIDPKKQSQAWFVICKNQELTQLREKLLLPTQDFHVTLAFDKSDVFGQPKDNSSIIYTNESILNNQKQIKNTP